MSTPVSVVPVTTSRPLAIGDFRRLWSGGLVSLVGTHMQFVALPFFVYQRTGSAFATALTATAQAVPGLTLGPVAGTIADTRDTRRVLVTANVALAAVTLGFCLVLVGPWWVVLGVALAQATVGQLVAPAEAVLIPGLVPAVRLPAANSLLGANYSLAAGRAGGRWRGLRRRGTAGRGGPERGELRGRSGRGEPDRPHDGSGRFGCAADREGSATGADPVDGGLGCRVG